MVRTKVFKPALSGRAIGNFLIWKVLALWHRIGDFSSLKAIFGTSIVTKNKYR